MDADILVDDMSFSISLWIVIFIFHYVRASRLYKE